MCNLPGTLRSSTDLINPRTRVKIISLFRSIRVVDAFKNPSNPNIKLSLISCDGVSGGVGMPRDIVVVVDDEEAEDLDFVNVVVGGSFQ